MNWQNWIDQFDFSGRVIVISGGTGVLGRELALGLAACRASLVVIYRNRDKAEKLQAEVEALGGNALLVQADVLERASLEAALEDTLKTFGRVDGLVNGAGGNVQGATTTPERSFFDLPEEALRQAFDLNLLGTLLPCQVFGRSMAQAGSGVILNISSAASQRPFTRIPAYAAAKAAVNNFTQWLAVHMAMEYSPGIRVNAVMPGFFLTAQNRYLLQDETTGEWTARGRAILSHLPAGRMGNPQDLVGPVVWLLSPASAYITGSVVVVDGGFSAYSGV